MTSAISVKVSLGEEIRKFFLSTPSFAELSRVITERFSVAMPVVKYKDEDGDLVTISSDEELKAALNNTNTIRLFLSERAAVPAVAPSIPAAVPVAAPPSAAPSVPAQPEAAAPASASPFFPINAPPFVPRGHRGHAFEPTPPHVMPPAGWAPHPRHGRRQPGPVEFLQRAMGAMRPVPAGRGGHGQCHHPRANRPQHEPSPFEARLVNVELAKKDMEPSEPFSVSWTFRNDSTVPFSEGCTLDFISHARGDQLGAPDRVPVPVTAPGQTVTLTVPMQAPALPGVYVGFWRMATADGRKFGQRVKVRIHVVGDVPAAAALVNPEIKALADELHLDLTLPPVAHIITRPLPDEPTARHAVLQMMRIHFARIAAHQAKRAERMQRKAIKQ